MFLNTPLFDLRFETTPEKNQKKKIFLCFLIAEPGRCFEEKKCVF
jgi:hypothetical protein